MSSAIAWFEPVTAFWCSLGGLLLTGVWLLVGRLSSPLLASRVSGVSAILLVAAAFALVALAPAAALPCLALSALAAILWATHSPRTAEFARLVFTPAGISSAGFVGCLAVAYLLGQELQRLPEDELAHQVASDIQHVAIEGMQGATDYGRPIEFVRYTATASIQELENEYLGDPRYQQEIIRLGRADLACNCHGWVFTGGQFGVRGNDVNVILADNRYTLVEHPQAGDLVIYRNLREEITHTGVVRTTGDNGLTLVESKWGPLGVYLHRPEMQPFGQRLAYYRSQRDGHRLRLDAGSSEPPAEIGRNTAKGNWRRPGPMGIKSAKVRSRQS